MTLSKLIPLFPLLAACQGLGPSAVVGTPDANRYDFDGDGHEDLAVGARATDENRGAVYVFLGEDVPRDRTDADADRVLEGDSPWQGFGRAVTGCDFDDDGYGDVVVGGGGIRVFFGGPDFTTHDGPSLVSDIEDVGDQLACGDVTGDGVSDIVTVDTDNPAIVVLEGGNHRRANAPFFAASEPVVRIDAVPDINDLESVAIELGDIDSDRRLDIIASSSDREVDGIWGAGAVYIFLGGDALMEATTTDDADHVSFGTAEGDHHGRTLAVVDLDSSGTDDLAVGTMAGELRLYLGGLYFDGNTPDQTIRRPEMAIVDPVWSANVQRPWRHDLEGPVLQVRARLNLDGAEREGAVFLTDLLGPTPPRCMGVVSDNSVRLADSAGALRYGDTTRWLMGAPGAPSADQGQVFAVEPDSLGLENAAPCHEQVVVVHTADLSAIELSGPKSFGAAVGN